MKPIRIQVAMFGGTIQAVFTDSHRPVRVVFTENVKYSDSPDDCVLVPVVGGTSEEFIYTEHDAEWASAAKLDLVWRAALKRSRLSQRP